MDVLITDEGLEKPRAEPGKASAGTETPVKVPAKHKQNQGRLREMSFELSCFALVTACSVLLFTLVKKQLDFFTLTCAISGVLSWFICLFLILTKPK